MTTYMIEPGDWESATGECLPRGSNGVEVRKVSRASGCYATLSALRDDGALRIGRVQCHGNEEIEIATAVSHGGGGRDVLVGELRLAKQRVRTLIHLLQTAVDEG